MVSSTRGVTLTEAKEVIPIKSDDHVSIDLDKSAVKVNVSNDDEPEIVFKRDTDYRIFQILDEDTRAVMGYIGGYALDISFNLQEMRSVEKIEQFLNGLTGLFRRIISDQILSQNK